MILPLQASIGPALRHNDPEKKGVDSLTRQEAMGYYQKNPRLEGWRALRSKGYQNLSQKEWKTEKNRQSSVSRLEVWTWLNLKSSSAHCRSCVQLWTNGALWMWVRPIHIFMLQETKAPERHSFFTGWGSEEDRWVNIIVQWQKEEDNDQWFGKVFCLTFHIWSQRCLSGVWVGTLMRSDRLKLHQLSHHCVCQIVTKDYQRNLQYDPWLFSRDIKMGVFAEAVSSPRSFSVLWYILRLNGIFSLPYEVCSQLLPFLLWSLLSSCILLVLPIFPTVYHWGYSTNTYKKYLWHSVRGAGLSKDGTLLAKSNFYISHLRKLESFYGALQIQLSDQLSTHSLIIDRELFRLFRFP